MMRHALKRLLPGLMLSTLLLPRAASAQDILLPEPAPMAGETRPVPADPRSVDTPRAAVPAGRIDAAPAIHDAAPEAPPTQTAPPLSLANLVPLNELPDHVRMGASLSQPGILRLTGEVAAITLGLDLAADQPVPQELQLMLRSAINVLPDNAVMQVSVNDAAPVDLPLRSFDNFQPVDLSTPALVAGPNRIRLALRQPHRVFCGPDASFGVWTELDLARSGAMLTAAPARASPQGFALALARQVGSGRALPVLVAPDADPALLRQLTDDLGAAMRGRGWIDLASPYDIAPRQGASVLFLPAPTGQPGRVEFRLDGAAAPVMVVSYQGDALPDLTETLQALALVPSQPTAVLQPGQASTLEQLGQGDIIGNTRYFRQDVPFRLPDDWLLLANQKARVNLHYGYAANLPKGAILLVKINDQTVRLLPLDRDGGKLLPRLDIGFAARLLHAGVNRLSFEMMVPGNPPDMACPPRDTDMLVVTRDTSLTVPVSPAMQLGGLAPSLAALPPNGIQPDPQVADHDRMQLAAAQLAAALPAPLADEAQVSLLVGDFSALPGSLSDVSLRVLQGALFPAVQLSPTVASVPPPPQFHLSASEPAAENPPRPTAIPADAPRSWSPLAWLSGLRDRLWHAAFLASDQSLSDWLDGRHGDALLIARDPGTPEALGLILGPEAEIRGISRALDGLRSSRQGNGAAALLSNDGSWQVWSPIEPPRLKERVTAANLFPILGNYASWSPLLFTCVLLGLGLISVLPALAVVIVYRKWRLR